MWRRWAEWVYAGGGAVLARQAQFANKNGGVLAGSYEIAMMWDQFASARFGFTAAEKRAFLLSPLRLTTDTSVLPA
jgi:hypothetical protein